MMAVTKKCPEHQPIGCPNDACNGTYNTEGGLLLNDKDKLVDDKNMLYSSIEQTHCIQATNKNKIQKQLRMNSEDIYFLILLP